MAAEQVSMTDGTPIVPGKRVWIDAWMGGICDPLVRAIEDGEVVVAWNEDREADWRVSPSKCFATEAAARAASDAEWAAWVAVRDAALAASA